MKLNTILSVFTPKDTKFIPLLNETSDILVRAATLLDELFADTTLSRVKDLATQIKAEETKGDRVTNKIFKELNNTFITPFDREDIDSLADAMDDTIDAINRSAHKVLLYAPNRLTPATSQLAGIIKQGSFEIKDAVKKLSSIPRYDKEIKGHSAQIKKLEEKADTIYESGIMDLFQNSDNAVELIKLKEITQELERSANRINRVGKILKTIIVKYA